MHVHLRLRLVLPLVLGLAACGVEDHPDTTPAGTAADAPIVADTAGQAGDGARATLQALGDSGVSGTVSFTPTEGGVQVTYAIDGLTPGRHGFHVHENGDCGPGEDGTPGGAAGDHFAPMDGEHGAPDEPAGQRHVGDFGNIEAGADGRAAGTFVDSVIALDGERSIVGRAVVVHAEEDDLTSQPSGGSGDRVGCGVVERSGAGTASGALPPGHPPIDGAPAGGQ